MKDRVQKMRKMRVPLAKLKAIMVYFANETDPRHCGKTKLMKLFYYLDFYHVKKYATPITGDQYFHLERGPIPTVILNMVDSLLSDPEGAELADTIAIETKHGSSMQRVVALREFTNEDAKLFSKSEMDVMKEVVRKFKDTDTNSIVNLSHKEAPWKDTDYRDPIPYSLAGRDADSLFSESEIELINSL